MASGAEQRAVLRARIAVWRLKIERLTEELRAAKETLGYLEEQLLVATKEAHSPKKAQAKCRTPKKTTK